MAPPSTRYICDGIPFRGIGLANPPLRRHGKNNPQLYGPSLIQWWLAQLIRRQDAF
jgi:hypothetical protein